MMKKQNTKRTIFLAMLMMFGMFCVMYATFLTAYSNQSKSVVVTIDEHNEANIEMFFVMPIVFLIGFIGIILSFKEYWTEGEKNEK